MNECSSDDSLSDVDNTNSEMMTKPLIQTIDLTGNSMEQSTPQCFRSSPLRNGQGHEIIDLSSPPLLPIVVADNDEIDSVFEIPYDAAISIAEPPSHPSDHLCAHSSQFEVAGEPEAAPNLDVVIHEDISDLDKESSPRLSSDEEDDESMEDSTNESGSSRSDGTSSPHVFGEDGGDYESDVDIEPDLEDGMDAAEESVDSSISVARGFYDSWDSEEPDDSVDGDGKLYILSLTSHATCSLLKGPKDSFWELSPAERLAAQSAPAGPLPLFMERNMIQPAEQTGLARGTAAIAIGGLLNDDKPKWPMLLPPAAPYTVHDPKTLFDRHPSPSDVVLSKSCLGSSSGHTTAKTSAEVLGSRTGKYEFFAAREQNKMSVSLQRAEEPRLPSSVYALCNNDGPFFNGTKFSPISQPEQAESATDLASELRCLHGCKGPSATFAMRAVAASRKVSTTQNGEMIYEQQSKTDELVAPLPADVASSMDDAARRTYMEIPDIVESCERDPEAGKGKRKADEISATNNEEEQWVAEEGTGAPAFEAPSSSNPSAAGSHQLKGALAGNHSDPSSPSFPVLADAPHAEPPMRTALLAVSPRERPQKRLRLRRIAERVGYAALGGVTAGAMIVGTLIYTAPTFT